MAFSSIPPPARLAVLPEIVIPSMFSVPGVRLKIPPPDPEAPDAVLLVIMVVPVTTRVPPLLKIPPPPSSPAAPCASFASIMTSVTVMVPEPFHSPPPSRAAVLLVKLPPVMLELAGPVICKAPPFPGALPVKFASKVLLVMVNKSGELLSIAPPALTEVLSLKEQFTIIAMPPTSTKIAPPLPVLVFTARLFVNEQSVKVLETFLTKTAPPPTAPLASLLVKVQLVAVKIPLTTAMPPPFSVVAVCIKSWKVRLAILFVPPLKKSRRLLEELPKIVFPATSPEIATSTLAAMGPLVSTGLIPALKVIVLATPEVLASITACRKDPGPASFVFVTVN